MTQQKALREDLGSLKGIGGKLLGIKLAELEGAKDCIVLSTGLLAGTGPLFAGRLSLCMTDPFDGKRKSSNIGGFLAEFMGRLDISALVIDGSSSGCHVIYVSSDGVEIHSMPELFGYNFQDTAKALFKHYGKTVALGCIDSLGESLERESYFGITDLQGRVNHFAGRRGIGAGAVFASKGIKAVVVDSISEKNNSLKDKSLFQSSSEALMSILNKSGESFSAQESECLDCGYTSCGRRHILKECGTNRKNGIQFSPETAFIDSTGICLFALTELKDNRVALSLLADMCNARYGLNMSVDDYLNLAGE